MKRVMVRYKVKPDRAEANEQLVRAVYAELARTEPDGLRYATLKLDDDVTFVHLAETEAPHDQLPKLKAFQEFRKDLGERCVEPPVATELSEIGSFRLFANREGGG